MKTLVGATLVSFTASAHAADIYVPQEVPLPQPPQIIEREVSIGSWYLRGDLNYHASKLRGTEYITYGPVPGTNDFDTTDLKGAFSIGGGVGYQVNRYFRTDLTVDYWAKSDFEGSTSGICLDGDPCVSRDTTSYSALLLMANAYVDLGTYAGITPYVGAGIGGAYVKWDELHNTHEDGHFVHEGGKDWRFAWSVMAGASYCLTDSLQLDAGYRYSRIEGGKMFEFGSGVGPGFDDGLNVHEARAGLRYSFGGNANCVVPQMVAYEPLPVYEEPVVYK